MGQGHLLIHFQSVTFESVILESVKIESVGVDAHGLYTATPRLMRMMGPKF